LPAGDLAPVAISKAGTFSLAFGDSRPEGLSPPAVAPDHPASNDAKCIGLPGL
jgi:hypothetical protein